MDPSLATSHAERHGNLSPVQKAERSGERLCRQGAEERQKIRIRLLAFLGALAVEFLFVRYRPAMCVIGLGAIGTSSAAPQRLASLQLSSVSRELAAM